MRRIADEDLDVDVVGALSAQEEVGERGCKVAVNRIRPDAAIVFEGCPADDTFGEPYAMQTKLRKGPMIRFMDVSVICNPRFVRCALDLAEQKSIPAQASVREGGGNDAAVIQSQLFGAPAIVLGVPVRYIHTPACIAAEQDYEATVALALALIRSLNESVIKSF
jgi:putative aminopeptidase FrvX